MTTWSRLGWLLALFALPIGLMLIAWVLYYYGYVHQGGVYTGATHNRGNLVRPPVAMGAWLPVLDKRWTVLVPGNERCDEACVGRLYRTRQAHIALGRKAYRVRRIYWGTRELSSELSAFLAQEHRGMETHIGADLHSMSADIPEASFYLVDPRGFLMMAYDEQHNGADLLEDLRFLLKISH